MRKRQLLAAARQLPNWKIVMELGRRALDHYGLKDWEFDVRPINHKDVYTRRKLLRGDVVGCAFNAEKQILLSGYAVNAEKQILLDWQILRQDEAYILEVLHHEIAHALIGRYTPHHGPRWQKKARELGVSDEDIAWGAKCDRHRAKESAKKH